MHDAAMKSMMRMIMTKTMMQHQPKWCTCIWSWSVWTQPARPGVCHRQREGPVMLQIPVKFVLPQEWNFPLHTIINFDVDQWILDTYSNKKNGDKSQNSQEEEPFHTLSWTILPNVPPPPGVQASNSPPQMLSPPVPSPCGSPVWIMKPWPQDSDPTRPVQQLEDVGGK